MLHKQTITEAVGYARKPGRCTIRPDARRAFNRVALSLFANGDDRREKLLGVGRMLFGERWALIAGASKGDTFENDLLKLIFNGTAIANIADNAATSPFTNLYFALHTADPGEAGSQTTSEIAYTSYARVAVARTTGGFTVTSNSVSPVSNVDFPAGTGGSGTATHFSVGTASSGSGKLLYSGTVTPNIVSGNGVTPRLTTATAITED